MEPEIEVTAVLNIKVDIPMRPIETNCQFPCDCKSQYKFINDFGCKKCKEHALDQNSIAYYVKVLDRSVYIPDCILNFDKFCALTQISIANLIALKYGKTLFNGINIYSVLKDTTSFEITADEKNIYIKKITGDDRPVEELSVHPLNVGQVWPRHE